MILIQPPFVFFVAFSFFFSCSLQGWLALIGPKVNIISLESRHATGPIACTSQNPRALWNRQRACGYDDLSSCRSISGHAGGDQSQIVLVHHQPYASEPVLALSTAPIARPQDCGSFQLAIRLFIAAILPGIESFRFIKVLRNARLFRSITAESKVSDAVGVLGTFEF